MKIEQMNMSQGKIDEITGILKEQGLSEKEINEILNGNYSEFQQTSDLETVFGKDGKFDNIADMLRDDYSMEEIQTKYPREFSDFQAKLDEMNITFEEARAINQYTEGSTMINSLKRGDSTKAEIHQGIMDRLSKSLEEQGFKQENIGQIQKFVERFDYEQPLHENYEKSNSLLQQANYPSKYRVPINSAIRNLHCLNKSDETIAGLDSAMQKARLPESVKLYRALKSEKGIFQEDNGYSSTSPIQTRSFDKYEGYDVLMELYAPKGTHGLNITSISDYGETEQEVLLGANDIFFTDVQQGVIGEDGKSKTVMKGLLLSKDRECYKGIDQPKGQNQDYQFDNKDNSNNTNIEQSNLPVKQSRFSKFFSQVRSKLARQKNGYEQGKKTYGKQDTEQYQQTFEGNKKTNQSQEKKSWKLEPEEKARIQKETVEIAKRHREQETQKQQESSQNIQQAQNNMQQSQQGQVYPQTPPAQPMMDMGGMEL